LNPAREDCKANDDTDLQNEPNSGCTDGRRTSPKNAPKPAAVDPPKPVPSDPDLAWIVEAWPTLPVAVKAGIVAMVKAAMTDRQE